MRRYEDGGVVLLTPALALEWLEKYRYDRQRGIKKHRRDSYALEMENGKFGRSIITFHVVNGQRVLTNGQHRASAVLSSGCPIEVEIKYVHCDDWSEVHEDYAIMDGYGVRTVADVHKALGLHAETHLRPYQLQAVTGAAAVLMTGFALDHFSTHILAMNKRCLTDGAIEWKDEGFRYFEAIGHPHRDMPVQMLRHRALVAVALVLMRHQTEKAFEFFEGVSKYSHEKGEAPHALAITLTGPRFWGSKAVLEMSRTAARCWNAFFDGAKPSTRPTQRELKEPILLRGTPYDGKQTICYVPQGWDKREPEAPSAEASAA